MTNCVVPDQTVQQNSDCKAYIRFKRQNSPVSTLHEMSKSISWKKFEQHFKMLSAEMFS